MLTLTAHYVPIAQTRYSFYPGEEAVTKFSADSAESKIVPIHERSGPRLFVTKWPGIITAFDALFKGETVEELDGRLASLFTICRDSSLSTIKLAQQLERWAIEYDFNEQERRYLEIIGNQIRQRSLVYDRAKIKRSFSGSIPRDARWYPPHGYVHYLYYEPVLSVPRNINPGKPQGWGTMNQWREPTSHQITPKLIYTTASRSQNGYAAFIVDDEWYVKLHGGTSQQFNYTGLYNPILPGHAEGIPNNLTELGTELVTAFSDAGEAPEGILYYVAGIWNSELASELLDEAGSASRPGIRIPRGATERGITVQISRHARLARDYSRLKFALHALPQKIEVTTLSWISEAELNEVGFERRTEDHMRFRSRDVYIVPSEVNSVVASRILAIEAQINDLVNGLYS